jgi:nucleotide-binding universal stress UspA family protein
MKTPDTVNSPDIISTKTVNTKEDRHILIAVNGSECARRAVTYVADLLGEVSSGFSVTLFSLPPLPEADCFESDEECAAWLQKYWLDVEKAVEEYRNILISSGFDKDKVCVRITLNDAPTVAAGILKEQKRLGYDTVVVARRNISRKEEFLFGSTSSELLHSLKMCALWIIE